MVGKFTSRALRIILTCVMGYGCASAGGRLEYRLASIEGEAPSIVDACRFDGGSELEYRYPSGRRVRVRVSDRPAFALDLTSTSVTLVDWGEIEPGLGTAVRAAIDLRGENASRTQQSRTETFYCDLLVLLDDTVVGLELGGSGSRASPSSVPAGTFGSVEAAESLYGPVAGEVTVVAADAEKRASLVNFWKWRRLRDLWEFQCNEDFRTQIQNQLSPEAFRALEEQETLDCARPPQRPPD